MSPTITNIKYLLRRYANTPWCCIWRDEMGVHLEKYYWDALIVGQLKWLRYKYQK